MDYIPLLVLLPLVVAGGWVLGIIGFFRAGRALDENRRLRALLERLPDRTAAPAAAPFAEAVPQPFAPPPIIEEPSAKELPASLLPPVEPEAAEVAEIPVAAVAPAAPPRKTDIEELLTLRWGVWAGAVALLLAAVFLVRYAIDEGLLGPATRCGLAVLLGFALIGGGDWLRRRSKSTVSTIADQGPAALASGGVAMLFGAAYAASVLYELVPPFAGFVLMAAAAFAGLALSLRMGQLVAAVGLVGAFVTPVLVQTADPSLPGLFAYLLLVTAAALGVVRYTAWVWLGWAATLAGVVWVLIAIAVGGSELWAPALFVPAAALLNLVLLPPQALEQPVGRRLAWIPFGALAAVGLLLALAEPGAMTRLGVLLLAPLAAGKAAREPRLDLLPWLGALAFLLLVLGWGLPPLHMVSNAVNARELGEPIFPSVWASDALRAFLATAAVMAGFFAACGLWFERRSPRPLRWSALTAAVPVLTLAVTYVEVAGFRLDGTWATAAVLLAAGLIVTARRALVDSRQRAGVHAAGAAAALALGCAMLLTAQWLTLAVALFLPALAWIEASADLPALRRVALAVAGLVLVRLLLNWYVLDYATGEWPVANALIPAYLVPALAFGWAALLFRRRADDLLVAVLEAGAAAFATVLVMLEIRQFAVGVDPSSDRDEPFWEAALHVSAMAILATVSQWLTRRAGRVVLNWAWKIQGVLALGGGALLIVLNPAFFDGNPVGRLPLLDALLPAYAVPAVLAIRASRLDTLPPGQRRLLAIYGLAATFAWITLEIRHLFHRAAMGFGEAPVTDAELWSWSGAWLLFGLALMGGGIRTGAKPLRLAALAVMALAAAKIFLIDMRDLVGLWRVLSFLGLGLALIGLGAVYRRFVVAPTPAE